MNIVASVTFPSESIPAPQPVVNLRRVRKWGDPVMKEWGFDVNQVGTSNFQAVRCYNKETGFGAVSNYLYIPHVEVMKLRDMQFPEQTDRGYFDEDSKMEWLCSFRGSLYMYDGEEDSWQTAAKIRWGTLTLGGNLVQVKRYEQMNLVINGRPRAWYSMAELVGFTSKDWERPLGELLAEGLVHYCYCAYFPDNGFGHSPKGVIYSPFYSPQSYDFGGSLQPMSLYLPEMWLEPK